MGERLPKTTLPDPLNGAINLWNVPYPAKHIANPAIPPGMGVDSFRFRLNVLEDFKIPIDKPSGIFKGPILLGKVWEHTVFRNTKHEAEPKPFGRIPMLHLVHFFRRNIEGHAGRPGVDILF